MDLKKIINTGISPALALLPTAMDTQGGASCCWLLACRKVAFCTGAR